MNAKHQFRRAYGYMRRWKHHPETLKVMLQCTGKSLPEIPIEYIRAARLVMTLRNDPDNLIEARLRLRIGRRINGVKVPPLPVVGYFQI